MTIAPHLRRDLLLLLALSLLVRLLTALPMQGPAYMDAAYYINGGLSLYQGRGFNEFFIWNYLDDPPGIPHPSHLYWMPLSSILVYLSFVILGPSYGAAEAPFVLLSALLPVLSFWVAYDVAHSRRHAWCGALFTLFSPFYMTRWVTPDNFAPFALAGGFCLWAAGLGLQRGDVKWLAAAGLGAGLAHLSRADGVLLVGAVVLAGGLQILRRREGFRRLLVGCLAFFAAYLIVMGPWFLRNWVVIGRPLSPAGVQTMWLTNYDDTFSYDRPLTVQSYLSWGVGNIVRSKVEALWANLGQLLLAGLMISCAPLGLLGVWLLRGRTALVPTWLYGVLLYLAMSLVFTFPGMRGGMLHSQVALLPALYAAAMVGLDATVAWIARRRPSWHPRQAQQVLSAGLVFLTLALGLFVYGRGLSDYRGEHPYHAMADWMADRVAPETRVMVNDPATWFYYSRLPALVIPNAGRETVLQVMARYGATYLVLDENNPSLSELYEHPEGDPDLSVVHVYGPWYVFCRTEVCSP